MSTLPTLAAGFLGGNTTLTVSSDFAQRYNPVTGKLEFHRGIDLRAASGTPLRAPVKGVFSKHWEKNAGLFATIMFRDSDGTSYYVNFMHMHSVDESLIGKVVEIGTLIGTTGGDKSDGKNAGCSTGPHLHLCVYRGSNTPANALDPKYYFLAQHTLKKKKDGSIIYNASNLSSFSSEYLITVNGTKNKQGQQYVKSWDITVDNETEFKKPKQQKFEVNENLAPGIWQIVKLLIDSSVKGKQIADSSIAVQMGSLVNFFRKVCQEPLVEFMGDTFGNNYYFITRKPPFDKDSILRMFENSCYDIGSDEIISTSLDWNNQEIYSWYRYMPYADVLGISESNYFCPAIFFPDIAAIWGSRPLCVQSNYYNYLDSGVYNKDQKDQKENSLRIIKNMVKDFRYIIESNVYNAFTRRGSITIKGNRKIKRGTLIQMPNSEIFHVDSVSQSYSITTNGVDRSTVLQVSKGILPRYINEVENLNGVKCSYFNIVDFGDYKEEDITQDNFRDIISNWKLNYNVFQFFLSRQHIEQFIKEYDL
jgi:murein DD-endopeptidase MepM/ murein hydrolase activator NlpD